MVLPDAYRFLEDVNDVPTDMDVSTPILFDMPGDGDLIEDILSHCVGLVAAGGALGEPRQTDATLEEVSAWCWELNVLASHSNWFG